jgi:hypothetical protein
VSFDFGDTRKLGNLPVIKVDTPSQSIDYTNGISSTSGSYKTGNLRGTTSITVNLISGKGALNIGGPVYGTIISIGITN